MTIEVKDYRCEGCGNEYSVRYDAESDTKPDFCPFCADEVMQEDESWDDIGVFYETDEDEDEYEN